ncbi:MAG: hypothetical protein H6Q12_1252 [Bacteroidetes bacterium]|nr:hypothetical protein [Bacteroidota bacterium]
MKKMVFNFSTLVISFTTCFLLVCGSAANAQKSQVLANDKGKCTESVVSKDANGSFSSHLDSNQNESADMQTNKDLSFDATFLKNIPSKYKTMMEQVNSSESLCFEISCYEAIQNKMEKDIESFFLKR